MNKPNRLHPSLPLGLRRGSFKERALLGAACLALGVAAYGCAADVTDASSEPVMSADSVQVSPVALKIEQAGRILERHGDIAAAKALLNQALSASDITAAERIDAVISLSRAHEAAGDQEQAIAILEAEIANKSNPELNIQPVRERLSELLMPEQHNALSAVPEQPVAPFAKLLASYAQPDANGSYLLRVFMSGGEASHSDELGTFNMQGALRAQRESDCPLCGDAMKLSSHVRQSNWMVIPEAQAQFDGAYLVFYFDLGKNRIPARYERHLPMSVASIVEQLEQGKSFTVAKERPGSPPAVLIAAPRTSMLAEVEQHVAGLEELPLNPVYVDIKLGLRPHEIRGVVRQQIVEPLRTCYETLRKMDSAAAGKIVMNFAITGEGAVEELAVTTPDASLDEQGFVSCVTTAGNAMHFPKTGERLTVTYPFILND